MYFESLFFSPLCGFNRGTAALTSMKLIIESKVMGESINAVFNLLTIIMHIRFILWNAGL